ncbi:hypothetical protein DFH94DRAFT_744226 [Russula ochroleuca]|uniref:Uncharacterized protein n=1 Tax=Russula ochroleuca TaxID=152965 RepID=A0A9P5T924_9AGAM|nr:hypothetical protein DFH94DRAFT_744226 [Russula ochroleuca]
MGAQPLVSNGVPCARRREVPLNFSCPIKGVGTQIFRGSGDTLVTHAHLFALAFVDIRGQRGCPHRRPQRSPPRPRHPSARTLPRRTRAHPRRDTQAHAHAGRLAHTFNATLEPPLTSLHPWLASSGCVMSIASDSADICESVFLARLTNSWTMATTCCLLPRLRTCLFTPSSVACTTSETTCTNVHRAWSASRAVASFPTAVGSCRSTTTSATLLSVDPTTVADLDALERQAQVRHLTVSLENTPLHPTAS